jgi:hypothetical protein
MLINHFIVTSQAHPTHTLIALCFTFFVSDGLVAVHQPDPLFQPRLDAARTVSPSRPANRPPRCSAIRQNRHKPRRFWSAVAERSGDTALER